MYEAYWHLSDSPFCTPHDRRWHAPSPQHTEALARLQYLIENRRPIGLLTGPPGTGKSQLLRVLLGQLDRTQRVAAFNDLRDLEAEELLSQLTASFRLPPETIESRPRFWRALRNQLSGLRMARSQAVLLFDHPESACSGCAAVLERLLTLAEDERFPLSLVVASRSRRSLPAALAEASSLRIELSRLDADETADYLRRELSRASGRPDIFDRAALAALAERTGGILREINRLSELALMAAMADGSSRVHADVVQEVARELDGGLRAPAERPPVLQNV